MKEERRAYGYIRVSTLQQADEGISLAAQRSRIEDWCRANDYVLAGVFEDAGISGSKTSNRPGLEAALKAACKAKAPLVVYSLSRLARSTTDAISLAERLQKAGADLVSLSEKVDTSGAMGKFFFTLLSALGQLELDLTRERTRLAMQKLKREGRRVSGIPPYGFDLSTDGRTLAPNLAEQRTIARMRKEREKGKSFGSIAAMLNAKGIPPKRGTAWAPTTVRSIIGRAES